MTDHRARVSANAVQFFDGTVDHAGSIDAPHVYVFDVDWNRLNSDQCTELAAALLEAADQIEQLS